VVFGLPMPPPVVAVATVLTILMVGWFFAVSSAKARWTHVALGLILAGALGNFYDRMIAVVSIPNLSKPIVGQVRDFLDFSQVNVMGLNYPYIFNTADVWLVIGVGILLVHWVLAGRSAAKAGKDKPAK
jgi:signal peptidase II